MFTKRSQLKNTYWTNIEREAHSSFRYTFKYLVTLVPLVILFKIKQKRNVISVTSRVHKKEP